MKLTELQIDRCGAWQDVTLALGRDDLCVVYGPNESGKSTLVEFIRGILYGFAPSGDGHRNPRRSLSGSLVLETAEEARRVHRSTAGALRGAAVTIADEAAHPSNDWLGAALCGIDERTFRGLFTVELRDMQDLGVLSGEDAGSRLYDASLRPEGRRLVEASRRAEAGRRRLIDPLQHSGELVRLFERHDELGAQLHEVERQRRQFDDWCRRRDRLLETATELRQRRTGIQGQLRGHLFLKRAWSPWQRLRELRQELSGVTNVAEFPEQGVERLDRIETGIAAAAEERDRLSATVRRLRERLAAVSDGPHQRHAGAIRGYVEQRAWLLDLDERREAARCRLEAADADCAALLEALGNDWTAQRVQALDLSPAGWQQLSGTVLSLRAARIRRQGLKRKCRQLAAACRELRDSLAECLPDHEGGTVEGTLTEARERLRRMSHIVRLQLRERELDQRGFSLSEHRDRIAPQLALPRWVHIVLGVFAFMGIVLAGAGLIAGVATSGIAGAIYAMLGITCGGLAWGLKAQYEGDARERMRETEAQLAATLADLREVRESIGKLVTESGEAPTATAGDGGDLVRRAAERVSELVDLVRHERKLRAMRRRLDDLRRKRDVAAREVETAQATWSELLVDYDLPEALPAGEALEAWQRFLDAGEAIRLRDRTHAECAGLEALWNSWLRRIADLAARLGTTGVDGDRPLEILEAWDRHLDDRARGRTERRDLRKQIRAHGREIVALQHRVDELKLQRDALFVQGGAASRDEFEERARQLLHRQEIEVESARLQDDLDVLCADHADIALVEDDLLAYDAEKNSTCLATLRLEEDDLDRDLRQTQSELETIEQNLRAIEDDRRATSLRFELEQVRRQLHEAARDWAIVETAAQAGDDLRREFERRHQPPVLVTASSHLARLTEGRYPTVWAPLGERRLLVDDSHGHSRTVDSLSRGTRELLLLAVRLAIVEELARKGVSLPLILDDVFVNFDDRRIAAAAEVLHDFASAGRQVLIFTCHEHLTQLFAAKGITPIRLPELRFEEATADAPRLAG